MLGSLTIVCVAWPLLKRYWPPLTITRTRIALVAAGVLALYGAALVSAGIPARSSGIAAPLTFTGRLPEITIGTSLDVQSKLDGRTARRIAGDLVADLELQAARARAPGRQGTRTRGHFRSAARAADGSSGPHAAARSSSPPTASTGWASTTRRATARARRSPSRPWTAHVS